MHCLGRRWQRVSHGSEQQVSASACLWLRRSRVCPWPPSPPACQTNVSPSQLGAASVVCIRPHAGKLTQDWLGMSGWVHFCASPSSWTLAVRSAALFSHPEKLCGLCCHCASGLPCPLCPADVSRSSAAMAPQSWTGVVIRQPQVGTWHAHRPGPAAAPGAVCLPDCAGKELAVALPGDVCRRGA